MNNKKTKDRLSDIGRSLCFLSPSLIGVAVFFILPFGVVVYYSLIDGVGSRNFVFLENFIKIFKNSAFLMAAKNTLSFSAMGKAEFLKIFMKFSRKTKFLEPTPSISE